MTDTAQRRADKVALHDKLTRLLMEHLTHDERELWLESVDEYKQQARREALEEAAKVARNPYSDAVEAYGRDEPSIVGQKIADAIDRLREER